MFTSIQLLQQAALNIHRSHKIKIIKFIFKSIPLSWQITCRQSEARGGGSKRTFGSPKSQSSPSQNLAECADQSWCITDLSDPSWSSVFGATMALVGPLFILLTFIVVIKFCYASIYQQNGENGESHVIEICSSSVQNEANGHDEDGKVSS